MYKSKFKYIKRFLVCALTVLLIVSTAAISASAAQVPTDAYNYWTDTKGSDSKKSVYSRLAFEAVGTIDAQSLNVPFFDQISDICVDNGNIYILVAVAALSLAAAAICFKMSRREEGAN